MEIHHDLQYLCILLDMLEKLPMHVEDIFSEIPIYVDHHNVAAEGSGIVWFFLCNLLKQVFWGLKAPKDIRRDSVSHNDPRR